MGSRDENGPDVEGEASSMQNEIGQALPSFLTESIMAQGDVAPSIITYGTRKHCFKLTTEAVVMSCINQIWYTQILLQVYD